MFRLHYRALAPARRGHSNREPEDQAIDGKAVDPCLQGTAILGPSKGRSRGGLSTIIGRADDPPAQRRGPAGPRAIHAAVRGLVCVVRLTPTVGQGSDAPQADALVEDLLAKVVLADAAYGSERRALASYEAQARARKVPVDQHLNQNT